MAHETTLYSVLRIPENASSEDIKQAYRRLVKLWHPDLHPDDMSAEKRMQEITEAYTVLSDPAKKIKYDDSLAQKRAATRAKQEEEARKAARAAAASAAAAAAANAAHVSQNRRTANADSGRTYRSSPVYESSYEDFTSPAPSSVSNGEQFSSPFVVTNNNRGPAPAAEKAGTKSRNAAAANATVKGGTVENLTRNERRMEDFSIALCVLFPILIPIVYKHMKESNKMFPNSLHYQDALLSMKIVAGFSIPLWLVIIVLIIKAIMAPHA